jgi:hypothetical protein
MAVRIYKSASGKIYWDTNYELSSQINKLPASWEMEVTIKPATPDITTTKQCSMVTYWKEI